MNSADAKFIWSLICLARNSSDEKFKVVEELMYKIFDASDRDLVRIFEMFSSHMDDNQRAHLKALKAELMRTELGQAMDEALE